MSELFLPHREVNISGARCAILPDAISTSPPPEGTVILSEVGNPWRIFCSSKHLQDARTRFPGVTLYGFWQVLAASGVWRLETPLLAYQDDAGSGQYVFSDGVNVHTGEVVGGELVSGPMINLSADIEIEWIDLAGIVSRLTAPSRVAETPQERLSHSQAASRGKYLRAGAAVAIAAFGFLVGDQSSRMIEAGQQETLVELQAELTALEEQGKAAAAGRIKELPDQQARLDILLALTLHDPKLRIERGLLSEPLKITMDRRAYERGYANEFDGAVYRQTGDIGVVLR